MNSGSKKTSQSCNWPITCPCLINYISLLSVTSIILLFHDFPWPTTEFHDFPGLGNEILHFTTFQFSNRFVQPACI